MRQHLADQEHLPATAGNRFADDGFRAPVGIHLGRVDQPHAGVEAQADRADLLCAPPAILPQPPRPLAKDDDGLA